MSLYSDVMMFGLVIAGFILCVAWIAEARRERRGSTAQQRDAATKHCAAGRLTALQAFQRQSTTRAS